MTHLFAFGLGYSARRLAQRLAIDGWRITGTSRSPEGAVALTARGWHGLTFDGSAPNPALTPALASATHVLVSIPPDSTGDPALRCHRCAERALPHAGVAQQDVRQPAWTNRTGTVQHQVAA